MVLVMMTKKYKIQKYFFVFIFSLFSYICGAQESESWVLAAQQFTSSADINISVQDGMEKMFPSRIMEKISSSLYRTIDPDEFVQRKLYELKKERTSLFLQYSEKVQKRDAILLRNYTSKELTKKLQEAEGELKEIKEKIDKNLLKQKELLSEEENKELNNELFTEEEIKSFNNKYSLEKINIYKNDYSQLLERKPENLKLSFDSVEVEKEIVENKVNALITGNIKYLESYVVVSVSVYSFPGGQIIASVTEFGSLDDADLICTSIARQLSPGITNAIPITITINIKPEEIKKNVTFYIDDVLQTEIQSKIKLNSGVHFVQFSAEGYETLSTTYAFSGNQKYVMEVNLEPTVQNKMILNLKKPIQGDFFYNGVRAEKDEEERSYIKIDGKQILGEFISEESGTAFFYIPLEKIFTEQITLDIKPFNRNDYIEKRRRWMYTSYSALVISLIPTFYLDGQAQSYRNASALGYITDEKAYAEANNWIQASNISKGISIGCGIWFVYELVRYLYAANSVLPVESIE